MKTTTVLRTNTLQIGDTEYFVLDEFGKPLGIIRKQHRRRGDGPRRHQWYAWVYPDRAIPGDGGKGMRPIEGTEKLHEATEVIKTFHVTSTWNCEPWADEPGVPLDPKHYTDKDGDYARGGILANLIEQYGN